MENTFITYADASKWMDEQSKKYKSKGAFYGSDEYKKAYPKLKELYDAERKETSKSAERAMNEAGVKYGDKVSYSNITPFGFSEEYSGIIVERNGLPKVKFDEGQETITGQKSVRWHKGWKKELESGGQILDKKYYEIEGFKRCPHCGSSEE